MTHQVRPQRLCLAHVAQWLEKLGMSISDHQSFPEQRLICGWQVTTRLVNCPVWIGQLSLPPLGDRQIHAIAKTTVVKTGAACLQCPKSVCAGMGCGLGWTLTPVEQRCCSLVCWYTAQYKCTPLSLHYLTFVSFLSVETEPSQQLDRESGTIYRRTSDSRTCRRHCLLSILPQISCTACAATSPFCTLLAIFLFTYLHTHVFQTVFPTWRCDCRSTFSIFSSKYSRCDSSWLVSRYVYCIRTHVAKQTTKVKRFQHKITNEVSIVYTTF